MHFQLESNHLGCNFLVIELENNNSFNVLFYADRADINPIEFNKFNGLTYKAYVDM